MPPHSFPSGDRRGPGVAGAVVDPAGGALAGGGAALTTPVGVNTGSALVLGAGVPLAAAVGACAPGVGAACDEQPKTGIKPRNATKLCRLKRAFMWSM